MAETVKTYEIDLTGCPCCMGAGCTWCGFCDPKKSPVQAIVTFAGFTGWATAMNRSFTVELGNTCNATTGCRLEGYWAGISCTNWSHPLWRKIRLEVFSATRFVVTAFSPNDATDPCATEFASGAQQLNPIWDNGTDDFTSGQCNEPEIGSEAVLAFLPSGGSTVCCASGCGDSIDLSGTTASVAVVSVANLPGTATLTFTGTCAAALGGTVAMTYDAVDEVYRGSATECNMDYEYDPCAGTLTGTGDCTVSGASTVTDLNPYAAECVAGSPGLTIGGGCACCSVADGLTTGYTIG